MSSSSRALVIGYGSIGSRHARILSESCIETACVTQQHGVPHTTFSEIPRGIAVWKPDYIVIASPTSKHAEDLSLVLDSSFEGPVLVEKPLFSIATEFTKPLPNSVFVGYNWRFHDAVIELRRLLADQEVLTASIYNAQFLPDWRPKRDYRTTSSAKRSSGGGVLRDLSHDLDLLRSLLGKTKNVLARLNHSGSLEIDTEDSVLASLAVDLCPAVNIYLSYLDRIPRHEFVLTTKRSSISCNLLTGEIFVNGTCTRHLTERDETFRRMHLAVLHDDRRYLCSVTDGMETVQTIDAIEGSAAARRMIEL